MQTLFNNARILDPGQDEPLDGHVLVAHRIDLAADAQVPDALAVLRSLPILRRILEHFPIEVDRKRP